MEQKEFVKQPEKKLRVGSISATIWNNPKESNGQTFDYKTLNVERSYKDPKGEWKKTNSFRVNDIPKVQLLLDEAYKYAMLNEIKN